jgi:hypothetical protein
MIPLTKGFKRSVNSHNVELDVLSDWMEASVLFSVSPQLPAAEIVDFLVQEEIYDEQSFCWGRIEEALTEVRRRAKMGPAFPIQVVGRKMDRLVGSWEELPAHSFLLLLTLSQRYDKWKDVMPIDYNLQGELFEQLTMESLKAQFPDWVIQPTGWSKTHPTKLGELVTQIAGQLGELQGEVKVWTDPEAKEAGLDLLCYRPYADGYVGVPLLMLQCASGKWDEPGKLKTPDLDIWTKIIIFASKPKRAFATPFCFLRDDFKKIVARVDGVLFDRYRLVTSRDERQWVSEELKKKLRAWITARLDKIQEFAN